MFRGSMEQSLSEYSWFTAIKYSLMDSLQLAFVTEIYCTRVAHNFVGFSNPILSWNRNTGGMTDGAQFHARSVPPSRPDI